MAKAGTVTVDFAAETAKFTAELKKVQGSLKNLEGGFAKFDKVATSVFRFATAGAGAAALISFTRSALAAADATGDAAERIGVTASSLSRLQFVAQQTDVEFSALTAGIQRFQVAMSKASDENRAAQETLAQFGVRAEDIIGLPIEQQLATVADAFQDISNPADRTRLAVELFGRSAGPQLVPLLAQGEAGIRELTEAADRLGITLDDRAVKSLDRSSKALDRFTQSAKSSTANIVGGFIANTFGSGDELLDLQARLEELNRRKDFLLAGPAGGSTIEGSALRDELTRIGVEADSVIKKIESLDKKARNSFRAQGPPGGAIGIGGQLNSVEIFGAKRIDADSPQSLAAEQAAQDLEFQQAAFQRAADFEAEMAELRVNSARQINEQLRNDLKSHFEEQNRITAASLDLEQRLKEDAASAEVALRGQIVSSALQTAALLATTSKKGAKLQKALAVAEATRNTYVAITAAIRAGGPLAIPAAVALGAFGFAQVAAILRTPDTGGGATGISRGPIGAPQLSTSAGQVSEDDAGPAGATSQPVTQVIINGSIFQTRETERALVDILKQAMDGRQVVLFGGKSRQAQIIRQGG